MDREVRFIQSGTRSGFVIFSGIGAYPAFGQKVNIISQSINVTGTYEAGHVTGLNQIPKENEIVHIQWDKRQLLPDESGSLQ